MSKNATVLANIRTNPALAALVAMLILALVVVIFSVAMVQRNNAAVQQLLSQADDLRSANYRLGVALGDAIEAGNELSFDEAKETLVDMSDIWEDLNQKAFKTIFSIDEESERSLRDTWQNLSVNTESLIGSRETVINVYDLSQNLRRELPSVQQKLNRILSTLESSGGTIAQSNTVSQQKMLLERMLREADSLRTGGADAQSSAEQFRAASNEFQANQRGLLQGGVAGIDRIYAPEAVQLLKEVSQQTSFLAEQAVVITDEPEKLIEARQATDNVLLQNSPALMLELSKLSADAPENAGLQTWYSLFFTAAAAALLLLIAIAVTQVRRGSGRLQAQQLENDRNQTAILRLLDELADLADGDLTTTATVSEDFTGAIADSINFTIDQLRVLVSRINDTAVRVSSAAQETQSTALHLAEASDHQAQEIAGASAAVNEMAVTIDQVSANAAESAAVAERSVSIANKGAEVVQNTIQGMDNIREQIQETSKRIKRLGESSQEIGDIVSLINDIADQTNILALNAAIQASMAGDAGRGFAVVADEVQRLAERSSAATKQIEALVKTIQTDTNEAVASMEQTTAEVVRGARLAQDAGVALEEIENVSTTLAELIQNISNAARQQASSAGHISNTMNVIQEITSQTSTGTSATARAIGHLAEMAVDLRDSVQGFKLPEEVAPTVAASAGVTNFDDERLTLD